MSSVYSYDADEDVTYDVSETTWTQGTPFKRLTGLDYAGIEIEAACGTWGGATVQARIQGCVEGSASSPPDSSANWTTLEALDFTANGMQRAGGADYLLGMQGFRFLRFSGAVTSGTPGADVTLSFRINADYVG